MASNYPRLHHEDLDSYQASVEFLGFAAKLIAQYPRGYSSMTEQLKKASLSIPLNIAEGYGKRSELDRIRYYDIARGSAHECGAILDASKAICLIDDAAFGEGKTLLFRIVSMLVKMCAGVLR